ncbi:hypothetical protein GCM10010172_18320 [Paractinoplanes ferrugineus]|uniref:Uncharacterized protein n=2 Tax=Paractinoplanes ferrugineus TaxID=113564 RepID=A0A919J7S7_9ACTN|nr:hypothetical protein Afe05nite_67170 [Actinoplanes ferrugineus]
MCFQCGTAVQPGAPACPRCGAPAAPAQPQPYGMVAPQPYGTVQPQPQPYGTVPPQPMSPQAQPPRAPRRGPFGLSTGKVVAIGLTVFLILVVGMVAVLVAVLGIGRDGPDSAVKDYFGALAEGDAGKALAQTYEGSAAAQKNPLLTSAALADPARRPSAVAVGKVYKLPGAEAWRVTVAFVANGKDLSMPVTVRKIDGEYVLVEAFTEVRVSPESTAGVTVNGVQVPEGGTNLVAFPGSYEIKVAGTPLIAETVVLAEQMSGSHAYASIFSRDLAPGVQKEVDKQVRAKLDACLKSTSDAPSGCPFRAFLPGEKPTVKWTMPTYPKIEIRSTLTSETGSARFSGSGTAHYEADYRDFFGAKKHEAGNDQIYLYGNVTVKDAELVVTFTN